jgi:HlyD family secretion protein
MSALFVSRQPMCVAGAAVLLLFVGCGGRTQNRFQGYVEGEFVYVASPLAGQLETLSVQRGQLVTPGQPLFQLDEIAEKAALGEIKAALVLSEAELARQEKLIRSGVATAQDLDRARSTRDQDKKRLDQTNWSYDQKKQAAPVSGLVYDTLFRQGEWVPAGKPVVVLLPPQNIKVRAFVPETRVGAIQYGDSAEAKVDGVKDPFVGKVSYISPKAEYTPPVIYSRETRAKLVFMVELIFDTKAAADLHPGQPVDVEFKSK